MLTPLFAALLMQAGTIGPSLPGDPTAVPTLPPQPTRAAPAATQTAPAPLSGRLERCLSVVATQPAEALSAGDTWLRQASGEDRAEAGHCRGMALVQLSRHGEAKAAFLAARAAVGQADPAYAARLDGLAGHASLLGGDAAGALPLLDAARAGALAAGEGELALSLQLDAAAARAGLGQVAEARASLAAAGEAHPDNAEVALMSATLARQANDLAGAQAHIERAAALAPREPQVALEAGVIAVLAGRTEAAAQSWRSVLAVAPDSPTAATVRGYLQQIGAAPAPAAEPASR